MADENEPLRVEKPLSALSLDGLDFLVAQHGYDAVVDGLMKICERRIKDRGEPASYDRENKIAVREWNFARSGSRGIEGHLAYVLENGPGSHDRATGKGRAIVMDF